MSSEAAKTRIQELRNALSLFATNNEHAGVYLDVGHSGWLSAETISDLLNSIDPDHQLVSGVSLNVANRRSTAELLAYADRLRAVSGRADLRALLDVGRNGAENTNAITEWCNPASERLGRPDSDKYDPSRLTLRVIIKPPGDSDGDAAHCETSRQPAGQFDETLLRQLIA